MLIFATKKRKKEAYSSHSLPADSSTQYLQIIYKMTLEKYMVRSWLSESLQQSSLDGCNISYSGPIFNIHSSSIQMREIARSVATANRASPVRLQKSLHKIDHLVFMIKLTIRS